MDKKLFSITCTTCRAKLAVRAESAIGTIVECPRCQSMVQVMPPPGWTPTAPPPAVLSGPPPLDRVAAVLPVLELEPTEASSMGLFFRQILLPWGAAFLATIVVVCGLLWFAFASSDTEQHVAAETDIFLPATEQISSGQKNLPTVNAGESKDRPSVAPGPQSGSIEQKPSATESTEFIAKKPPSTSPILPTAPSEEKPPQVDLFPAVAEQPQPVAVKKAPPAYVDIAARLTDPISGMKLTDQPLVKAIELLASVGGLPVTLDAEAIRLLGVAPRDPISLQLGSTTIGDALQAVAAQKGLAVMMENDQVRITSPSEFRETLRTVRYSIDDLADNDNAVAELAGRIEKLVAPESWQSSGGRGEIRLDRGVLVVAQTGDVQRQVLIFCEKLRNARHKPFRSRENPEHFSLTTRRGRARTALTRPVTANFHEPTPLGKILAFLSAAGECDILIDRAALAAAETSDRVEATLSAKNRAFSAALDDLLQPLGLTYLVVGPNTIEVSTHEAADERLELEFYPIGAWLHEKSSPLPLGEGQGVGASFLMEQLKSRVSPSTWTDVGGLAEVYFDLPSQCLMVLQSQPAQTVIEQLLTPTGNKVSRPAL